jgi:Fe-Mn family superoxide dismutase
MSFTLPALPYSKEALEPHISAHTLSYHYDKHHATYVNKLNGLIANTPLATETLESIIQQSEGAIFNNAAQVWNHTFYWHCLTPSKDTQPSAPLQQAIEASFGSVEQLLTQFKEQALANFGSGWTWLVAKPDGTLAIVNTSNAHCPLTTNDTALLTCDVWEHAYYLDRQNDRGSYVDNFFHVLNWDFASANFNQAS